MAGNLPDIELETLAAHWNAAYPVGTTVDVRALDGTVTRTTTRSTAWVTAADTALVLLEGSDGGHDISRITVVAP